jgi:lysophospholipase L1-like esterase
LWGWSQQATQGLTDDGLGTHSLVNYACSGQQKAATWNTFLNVIAQGGLHTAIMLPWSPNDGESNVELFRFHVSAFVSECRKYGVKPILATQPPATTIVTNGFDIARKKINSEIRSFSYMGIPVADFDEVTSDQGAPARFISGLGRDGVHPSDLGHAAMAAEYKRALLEALSL